MKLPHLITPQQVLFKKRLEDLKKKLILLSLQMCVYVNTRPMVTAA